MPRIGQAAQLEALSQHRRRFRERISLALHDDVCQTITAAGLELDLLKMDLPPEHSGPVSRVQQIMEEALDRLRLLSHEVHPDPVQRFGFKSALERMADSAARRFKGKIERSIHPGNAWDSAVAALVHDIVDAAVDDAVQFTGAKHLRIHLNEGGAEIEYDGTGPNSDTPIRANTLTLMTLWAKEGNLVLRVTSTARNGTIVTVRK